MGVDHPFEWPDSWAHGEFCSRVHQNFSLHWFTQNCPKCKSGSPSSLTRKLWCIRCCFFHGSLIRSIYTSLKQTEQWSPYETCRNPRTATVSCRPSGSGSQWRPESLARCSCSEIKKNRWCYKRGWPDTRPCYPNNWGYHELSLTISLFDKGLLYSLCSFGGNKMQ